VKFLIIGAVMAVALTGAVAIACSEDEPTEEEAREQLCSDIDTLRTEMTTLQSLSAESTVDDLREARDSVSSALEDVQSSAADVADAELADAEAAFEELQQAVDDLDGDQSIAAAVEEIAPQVQAFEDAVNAIIPPEMCPAAAADATEQAAGTATQEAGAALTATFEAAGPEVRTAIAGTAIANAGAAQTATVEAAIP
jgi:hypothetical protein